MSDSYANHYCFKEEIIMINFEFHNPTKVIFGKNVEAEAGK